MLSGTLDQYVSSFPKVSLGSPGWNLSLGQGMLWAMELLAAEARS